MGWVQQGNIKGPSTELSLPAYAGNRLKQWDPAKGAYNLKASNTKRIRAALRKAQFGAGACHITNISDSSSSGFIGGQSAAGYDLAGAWPMTLRDIFNRQLGIPSGGTGFVPAGQWPLNDSDPKWALGPRWTYAGTVTNNGGYMTLTGTTALAQFTSDQAGTQVDVMYYNTSGAFNVMIDGVLAGSPARTGGQSLAKATYTGLSDMPHTVQIIPTTATAVYLMGIHVGTLSRGLHMHNLGIYGEKAYGFDLGTDLTLAAVNRPIFADAITGSTAITDLLILKIGANDRTAYLASTTPTYTTKQAADALKVSLRNLRNKPKYVNADVLLIMQNNTDDDFSAMYYDLADELDCPLIDTRWLLTSPTQAITDGIITPLDNTHYNARGQKQVGAQIAAPFVDMMESAPPQQGAGLVAPPKPDLISSMPFPYYIAHRGGHGIHGEHSMEAYQWASDQGFAIEPDVQLLADGTLVCIHDATTTRTMVQLEGAAVTTVNLIATARLWKRNYRILPEIAGGDYGRPQLFTEVLDQFGGKTMIIPEIKVTAARVPMCNEIVKRGLERAVIVQSFDINDCIYAVSRGMEALLLGPTQTAAVIKAAGINYVGCPDTATDTYVDSLVAAGIKVGRYTINSRTQADAMISANRGSMFFSDDPEWVAGRGSKSYSDPFSKRYPPQHLIVPTQVTTYFRENLMFKSGGLGNHFTTLGTNTGFTCDWCPPIASGKANIYFEVEYGEVANSQTRWVGIFFGTTATVDDPFIDSQAIVGQNGWHCLARRDGTLDIYQVVSNAAPAATPAATLAGTTATTFAAASKTGVHQFKFSRTATGITLMNLTLNTSVTFANAVLNTNAKFQFNFNGTEATVRNVRVEEIP